MIVKIIIFDFTLLRIISVNGIYHRKPISDDSLFFVRHIPLILHILWTQNR